MRSRPEICLLRAQVFSNYQLPITNYQLPITNYQLRFCHASRVTCHEFCHASRFFCHASRVTCHVFLSRVPIFQTAATTTSPSTIHGTFPSQPPSAETSLILSTGTRSTRKIVSALQVPRTWMVSRRLISRISSRLRVIATVSESRASGIAVSAVMAAITMVSGTSRVSAILSSG